MADEGKKRYTSAEMQKWLFEKAAQAKTPAAARKTVLSNEQRGRSGTLIGRMYFYKYDPKGKLTLSEYDKFPMCVPIEKYSDGFLGLNLHYLPEGARMNLVKLLLMQRNTAEVNDRTVMQVNYDLVRTVKKINKLAAPCVHRYLFTQVRSRFIEIYPSEYDIATQLPVEDWVFNQ